VHDNRYPRARVRSRTEEKLKKRLRANKLAKEKGSTHKTGETLTKDAMGDAPPRITMGDYCKRTDNDQISLGFQLTNLANFDIKVNVLVGLRENQFD
jgi:hypothetical protein